MFRASRFVFGLTGVAGLAAGCGAAPFSTSSSEPPAVSSPTVRPYEPDAADGGGALAIAEDAEAGAPSASSSQGNPLCNASLDFGCYPDLPTMPQMCGQPSDAGAGDRDDEGETALACRVEPSEDGGAGPVCEAAGVGIAGSPCVQGTDCAAGFECVANACRHYCCSGNSACALDEFCDDEPTTESPSTIVPVCELEVPCTLLQPGCPVGQSCQVVREDGTTSCVTVGDAQTGQACDKEHCAAGLVCLGTVGARTCYTLCAVGSATACPAGQTCSGGLPLFPDPSAGYCH